ATGERDGLVPERRGEDDGVAVVGGGDLGAQRAGAAVVVVRDRERAGHATVFQELQAGQECAFDRPVLRNGFGATVGRRPTATVTATRESEPACREHGWNLQLQPGLRYNEKVIAPSAQTERSGDAWPVRALLGGGAAPAAFFFVLP